MSEVIDIPGYRILSKIGEGGTAVVWRARQTSLDRDVAIKILRRQFTTDAAEVQAFLREAHTVAKLSSRHVIRIIDAGRRADTIFLVMEYVDGYPVQRLLSDGKPLPLKQALNIALAVADALNEAWDLEKIIHRDIKPDNIILNKRGEVKVADLGLVGIVDKRGKVIGESDGTIAGTPNYMSPEQAAGSASMNFATDMYSLGAVLYHLLTGCMPFSGRSAQDVIQAQIGEQIPHPCDLNPKVTGSCAQLVTRLMMKDPALRYPDWTSVIVDINRILDGRMVILKHTAEGGSTVASRREAAASGKKTPRRGAASAAPAGAKAPESAAPVPIALRISLQAAALLFFAWLIYALLWVPYRRVSGPAAPAASGTPVTDAPVVAPPVPLHKYTPSAGTSAGRQSDSRAGTGRSAAAERASSPESETQNGAGTERGNRQLLEILRNSILHVAVSGGMNAALTLLEQQRGEAAFADARAQLDDMERVLRAAGRPNALIAEQFRRIIGQDTYIIAGSRRVDFRVEDVRGETVSTTIRVPPGSGATDYPAELRIEVLEPAEARRWLAMGRTPEYVFSAAVMDLASGNFASALQQAEACGPFADAVAQYAGKRIETRAEE